MKTKNIFMSGLISVAILSSCSNDSGTTSSPPEKDIDTLQFVTSETFRDAFNIIIVSDWGRNGIPSQQAVADQMGRTGDSIDPEFIVSCGDNFQINGVASAQDPLWMVNFENVYKGNSLQVDWYPVLGNHDYKGNTKAQIDYSKISRRWRMIDRNYTFAKKINDSISVRFIFIDTPPLIDEYRNNPEEYPDAIKQDADKEIKWLKDVFANSKEQWKIVFGHHPVYSASQKHGNTKEMISRIKPLLEQYNAQLYICGHDHDFQHLRERGRNVDYIVTGTGSETRPSSSNEMSLFSKSEPGFSVVSLKADSLRIFFVGTNGNIVYNFVKSYK
jgi:hypothetical protein